MCSGGYTALQKYMKGMEDNADSEEDQNVSSMRLGLDIIPFFPPIILFHNSRIFHLLFSSNVSLFFFQNDYSDLFY